MRVELAAIEFCLMPAAAGEGWRTTNSHPNDLTLKVLHAVLSQEHHAFDMRCPSHAVK